MMSMQCSDLQPAIEGVLSWQVVLSAEVSAGQEIPPGQTTYGTPRTFKATIANLGTGGSIDGNATLLAGSYSICTALLTNASIDGTNVSIGCLSCTPFK